MTCGIYMIRNKVNGKMYIGQATDIKDRWKDHRAYLKGDYHKNKHLQNAWNKYGEENFEFSILMECEKSQLNTYEQYFIFELMTYNDRVGYNKNYGGYRGRPTEETKKKISENHAHVKGEDHPMYGKHHTKEARKKMSEANKGEKHHMYGKHHTEESKSKMSEANSKPVVQINPNTNETKVWESAYEAGRQGGFNNKHISLCCNDKQKTHKGFKWMFLEDYKNGKLLSEVPELRKSVVQLDIITNEIVKVFNSIMEAAKQTGFNLGAISLCCNNRYSRPGNNIYKGYKWMFLSDYEKLNEEN